jgi:hypothetical protein
MMGLKHSGYETKEKKILGKQSAYARCKYPCASRRLSWRLAKSLGRSDRALRHDTFTAHSYHGGGQPQFILSDDQDLGYGVLMSKTYMAALVVIPRTWKMG